VLTLNEFGGKFIERLDLLLLRSQRFLEILMFLDERLDAVQTFSQIIIGKESLKENDELIHHDNKCRE